MPDLAPGLQVGDPGFRTWLRGCRWVRQGRPRNGEQARWGVMVWGPAPVSLHLPALGAAPIPGSPTLT